MRNCSPRQPVNRFTLVVRYRPFAFASARRIPRRNLVCFHGAGHLVTDSTSKLLGAREAGQRCYVAYPEKLVRGGGSRLTAAYQLCSIESPLFSRVKMIVFMNLSRSGRRSAQPGMKRRVVVASGWAASR